MATSDPVLFRIQQLVMVGRRNLDNRVLLETLRMHMDGTECFILDDDDFRRYLLSDQLETSHGGLMVLFDCTGERSSQLVPLMELAFANACQPLLVLYQCGIGTGSENLISWPGVRGFFHDTVLAADMLRGLDAICAGEYWIPRLLVIRHLEQTRIKPDRRQALDIGLTPREAEILVQLSGGYSNQDIADRLELSCHTIKTHVYNLFRKVGVSNRVQLVNWAREHRFDDCDPGMLRLLVTAPLNPLEPEVETESHSSEA
ncbi:helix-turn-helix transcriptional regulator [Parathalassolituus penaei]|uniref:Response regulator transcription factor n=1 Tax=Parathalassolituus penaei TaxID=2997323 RepID=A0A9X3ECR5_9GAMM|nr:response regulator transcription factor [Parathalassolituus penaei]MCY0964751.1 response regulator transcription factor [Parathalassolituus penaei]